MTWLVDGRALARKVKNSPDIAKLHSRIKCHQCGFIIDQSNGMKDWPGLPAGVKFDPSDLEILEHLAAKLGHGNAKPHPFIDEFVPTIPGEGGICYTHPERLPGVRRDGSSAHFFHAPAKSYSTGNRKRRKVLSEDEESGGPHHTETRWHKTGKTKVIIENGIKLGCKKIMVLYATNNKVKPEKTNWVMHQYHLGDEENESEGDMLISKVFYQTQSRVIRKDDECTDFTDNMGLPCEYTLQPNTNTASRSVSLQGTPLTPKISAPSRPPIGKKHHKGLLETINEDVNRLNLSLNASAIDSWSSQENNDDYLCHNNANGIGEEKFSGLLEEFSDNQLKRKQSINEVVDSMVLETRFNSEEAVKEMDSILQCFIKIDSKNRTPVPGTTATKPQLHTRLPSILNLTFDDVPDEDESKCDNGLSNIILDTPPELLLDSLVGSQDTLDWLGKRKFGSESQSQTGSIQQGGEDFNALDFLRNSQSSS